MNSSLYLALFLPSMRAFCRNFTIKTAGVSASKFLWWRVCHQTAHTSCTCRSLRFQAGPVGLQTVAKYLECREMSSRTGSNSDKSSIPPISTGSQQTKAGYDDSGNGDDSGPSESSRPVATPSSPVIVAGEEKVDFDKLTEEEMTIYRLHRNACEANQSSYIDTSTGYVVLTQNYHITRGKCCGNCCRHCPYGHESVPEKFRTKTFNSAFYV